MRFPIISNKKCKRNNRSGMKHMGQVILLQFLVEKTTNNEIERQMIFHEIMSIHHYLSFYHYIYHHYNMVYEVFDSMIKSQYLTNKQKETLINMKNRLMKKQHKLNNL